MRRRFKYTGSVMGLALLCAVAGGGTSFAGEKAKQPIQTEAAAEEDHHFRKEGDRYYRVSKIYHETYNRKTGRMIRRKLLRDNHSEVMYDPALIPGDLIRD